MPLNPNALVTLQQVRDHLDITGVQPSIDPRLELMINVASERIERFLDRKLLSQEHTENFSGGNNTRAFLDEWPVSAIASLKVAHDWKFSDADPLDPDDYRLEGENTLALRSMVFQRGELNYQCVYTAGYTLPMGAVGPRPLPSDIGYSCLLTVEWMYQFRADRRIGVSGKTKGDETISFSQGLPNEVKEILAQYRRLAFADLPFSGTNL
jgi:hypothetical protein